MDDREFRVYRNGRGMALAVDGDGEMTIRLSVPRQDRQAVLDLMDVLSAQSGQVAVLRMVGLEDAPKSEL